MRHTSKYYVIGLCLPITIVLLVANSAGPPAGYTGSLGDGGVTCTECHDNSGNFNASVSITTDIPSDIGYTPGETYTIDVIQSGSAPRHGFQLTAENNSGIKKGTFTSLDSNTRTISNDQYAEHTTTGTLVSSWKVNWTAPVDESEPVIFYAASNAANNNGTPTGDQIVLIQTQQIGVLSIDALTSLDFLLYPNPGDESIQIDLPEFADNTKYTIYDLVGRVITQGMLSSVDHSINISDLKSGSYLLRLKNDNKNGVKKFIKK